MLQTLKDEVQELRQTVTRPQTLQALMDEVEELREKVTDMQTKIDELESNQRWRPEWNAWGERFRG